MIADNRAQRGEAAVLPAFTSPFPPRTLPHPLSQVFEGSSARIEIKLDAAAIARLRLDINAQTVAAAIRGAAKLRLGSGKDEAVTAVDDASMVVVRVPSNKRAASRTRAEKQRERDRAKERERALLTGASAAAAASASAAAAAAKGGADADDAGAGSDADSDDGGAGVGGDGLDGFLSEGDDSDDDGVTRRRPGAGGGRGGRMSSSAAAMLEGPTNYVTDVLLAGSGGATTSERDDTYFGLQALKAALPSVIVQGIPTVNRAVITQADAPSKDGA